MKRLFKYVSYVLSCVLLAFSVETFNPFWPTWGRAHDHPMGEHASRYTATNLDVFLRDGCFSSFEHVSAILSLIFLYVGAAMTVVTIVVSVKKAKKWAVMLSCGTALLLVMATCFLPFSHDVSLFIMWVYFFLPTIAGGLLVATSFIDVKSVAQ